ncbi:MAG: DNA-protecting protein DprA [Christensenellaceae bacterium]|jgi:DNA processing protein|nr:DNA-protecting protein DprA [Christensenellaceae bacterium]
METVIIKINDPNYPKRLLDLPQPPEQLYCRGRLELLNRPAVAIVGTRDCTRYGVAVAKEIAEKCVANGIVVISGGASGIDTSAHLGALQIMGGESLPNTKYTPTSHLGALQITGGAAGTISVLGNGLDHCYPTENWEMQKQIEREGLLISEYTNNLHANKETFPQRNRIVAGLADAVVVVECDFKSGTMITVRVAKQIEREIFAVAGSIKSYASNGPNNLIKNEIAKIVTCPEDILDYFHIKTTDGQNKTEKPLQIGIDEKNVLDVLGRDEVHLDELIEKCGMPVHALMTLLTDMELSGLIQKLPGNYVVAK